MQESSSARNEYPLARLGLDSTQAFYDLNLAGSLGVPLPQVLAQPEQTPEIVLPDFGAPNHDVPQVLPYDLTSPGITYVPEFAADPALPDLDSYAHPYDMDIVAQTSDVDAGLRQDVPFRDELIGGLPQGLGFSALNVHSDVTDVDPLVPDLQQPDLAQGVQRPGNERPGDLAPSALDVLHATTDYQQQGTDGYPRTWMDARGNNNTRARHLSLLDYGFGQ